MTSPQLALFAEPRARAADPETSHAAARAQAGGAETAVMQAAVALGDFTDDELCRHYVGEWYGPTLKTARSRCSKLGLLTDTGRRRPSSRGRDQIVWRAP